jgi:NAD(P)-dependent dehydrogenase (short-subunit alcohol dehydrogenase family)
VYGASKGAVQSFTIRAAAALASHGIRVNGIAPGTIDTASGARLLATAGMTDDRMAEAVKTANGQIPLGRPGTPDDIATVALFLASDAARYVTGVMIPVDGGRMAI